MLRINRILMGAFFAASVCFAQNNGESKPTYFERISIDSEGHICYSENIGTHPLNRIEYKTNGKSELAIFFEDDAVRVNVQIADFNNDGKADLIYVMKEDLSRNKGPIRKTDYYRGAEYLEHLKRHYKHALLTATHPLIRHRPDEQERARQIELYLEKLNRLRIETRETGTYTQEKLFVDTETSEIEAAFSASDTLNAAVRTILAGDFRVLSKTPEITAKYSIEIHNLLSIDPPVKRIGQD